MASYDVPYFRVSTVEFSRAQLFKASLSMKSLVEDLLSLSVLTKSTVVIFLLKNLW